MHLQIDHSMMVRKYGNLSEIKLQGCSMTGVSLPRRERCAKDCLLPWFCQSTEEEETHFSHPVVGDFFEKILFFRIIWLRTKGASAELLKDSAQKQTHDFLHELIFMGLTFKQMWCKSELWLRKPDLEWSSQCLVLCRHLDTTKMLRNRDTCWKDVEFQQPYLMVFDLPALPGGITQKEELATIIDAGINVKWTWRVVEVQFKKLSRMLKMVFITF